VSSFKFFVKFVFSAGSPITIRMLNKPFSALANSTTEEQTYTAFVAAYAHNRLGFVRNVLKIEPEDWQLEALAHLDMGGLRLAVKSGHGVGKSALLSWVIIHFMLTRHPQKTVVTAPTSGQLFDALAAEVRHWLGPLPPPLQQLFVIKAERVELMSAPADSFVAYRTSRQEQPEALQGVHADNVLLVGDEASGIPDGVYQAAGGSLSTKGSIFILAGNPTRAEGYFFQLYKNPSARWKMMTVSCTESTRVDPDYIQQIADQYGRDSNVFRVRCLGEFPLFDEDKLIGLDLLESATNRNITPNPDWTRVWGLDVARGGADRSALVERHLRVVTWCETRNEGDLMNICGWVKAKWDETLSHQRPVEICVDAIGMGAGVADRLIELGLPALAINVAEVSAVNPQASRLRDDIWLSVRDWFARKDVSIPDDPDLFRDLQAPTFKFDSAGKLKVASKEEMKRAGYRSPDLGDALALTFAGEGALTLFGSEGYTSSWTKEINTPQPAIC